MKIIISPAKKMITDNDFLEYKQLPKYICKAEKLIDYLKSISYNDLKSLLACNDSIAKQNYERYQNMNLYKNLSPAILSYDGIQYKYMAPQVFEDDYFDYIEEHLRILSGLYGILNPFDGVTPYRLEMQTKLKTDFCKNLYDYWQNDIYDALIENDNVILNLASNEYSKTISKYLSNNITYISCIFGEYIEGNIKEKGVYVKMARGEMVRFMAENNIKNLEEIKYFDRLGFKFNKNISNENRLVFIKEK